MSKLDSRLNDDKKKLLILICILLSAGFFAVSLLNYQISKATIRDALVNRELPLTSDNIYSEIQKDLIRPVFISSMMANDTFLRDWVIDGEHDANKVTRYLLSVKEKYSAFTSFLVSEKSGSYYHSNGVLKKIQSSEPRDAWYFRVRSMTEPYEINVDPDLANKDAMTIFINYRIANYQGSFIGATGIGLTVDSVRKVVESYRQRYQRHIFFVDSQGKIVLSPKDDNIEIRDIKRMEGLDGIADSILRSGNGSYQYRSGGNQHLLNVRYIPELKWYIFVEKNEGEALSSLRRALFLNMGICLLVTLSMIFLINFAVKHYQRRLVEMATTDALTGMANRQAFEVLIQQVLAESRRSGTKFAVVMGDIDHFKLINDSYGHMVGDRVLQEIGAVLRSRLRESDIICRWGGEEFLLIFNNCDTHDAAKVAEDLRTSVSASFARNSLLPREVTISFGVAEHLPDESLDELLARVDQALYQAKNDGRNRICLAIAPLPR